MLQGIVEAVSAELADDILVRTAHAVALRIASLDHEAGDNSVEGKAVVEALLNELFKVCYSFRCGSRVELELDPSAVFSGVGI